MDSRFCRQTLGNVRLSDIAWGCYFSPSQPKILISKDLRDRAWFVTRKILSRWDLYVKYCQITTCALPYNQCLLPLGYGHDGTLLLWTARADVTGNDESAVENVRTAKSANLTRLQDF